MATTNAAGQYSVQIQPSVSGTPATVSASGYFSKAVSITITGGSSGANDAQLKYDLEASIAPTAVRSGSTLTVSSTTTAPAPSGSGYACAWGWNGEGELGNGTSGSGSTTPTAVSGLGGAGTLSGATEIASTGWATYALLANGTVAAWGYGPDGELGNGTTNGSTTPVLVSGVGGVGTLDGVTAIAANGGNGYALLANGTVAAWGYGPDGELGNGTTNGSTTPVLVSDVGTAGALTAAVAIAAAADTGYALLSDGSVVAWGYGSDGELGNGNAPNGNPWPSSSTPVQVSGEGGNGILNGVTALAATSSTAYALLSNGNEVSWGYGSDGELGDGTTISTSPHDRSTPGPVVAVGGATSSMLAGVTAIAGGAETAFATLSNGTEVAWGVGSSGQLGNGTTTASSSAPVYVMNGANPTRRITGISGIANAGDTEFATRVTPCTDTKSAARVIAELPDGSVVALSQGITDSAGSTSWSGTITVPPDTAEGTYAVRVCAVDFTFPGNCTQASAVGAPSLATNVYTASYVVDNTAPAVSSSSPSGYSDVASDSAVSVTWSDNLSGIDPTTFTMTVDGQPVTVTPSGSTETASFSGSSALSAGIHLVTATVADKAGNVGTTRFDFSIVTISESSADAYVECANPSPTSNCYASYSGSATGAKITFTNIPVMTDPFTETLGASARAGYGEIDRPYSISNIPVDITDQPVDCNVKAGCTPINCNTTAAVQNEIAPHGLATLAPSGGSLTASIPSLNPVIPLLTVTLSPTSPCSALSGRAHLGFADGPLGAGEAASGLYLASSLAGKSVSIMGSLGVCRQAAGSVASSCQVGQTPSAQVSVAGVGTEQAALPLASTDPNQEFTSPLCATANGGQGCATSFIGSSGASAMPLRSSAVFGCSLYQPAQTVSPFNLCSLDATPPTPHGYAGVYMNAWVFSDPSNGYPVWEQDHVDVDGAGDACPNQPASGVSGVIPPRVTATVERAVAGIHASDGANGIVIDPAETPLYTSAGTFRTHSDPSTAALDSGLGGVLTAATVTSSDSSGPIEQGSGNQGFEITPQFSVFGYQQNGSGNLGVNGPASSAGFNQVLAGTVDPQDNTTTETPGSTTDTANVWEADTNATGLGLSGRVQLVGGTEFVNPPPAGFSSGYGLSATLGFQFTANFSQCTS